MGNSKLNRKTFENKFVVSYLGNLGVCQDMDTIINAVRLLKDDEQVVFLFAGHGSKMPIIRKTIKREKLNNVIVLDYLHGQDFVNALKLSDCFLVSLVNGLEGLCVPSKIFSYMVAAKPVIAIMENGFEIVQDIIHNEAGFAVAQGDSKSLVKNIKHLQRNENLLDKMGLNCLALYTSKYSKKIGTEKYISLVRKVLEDH